MATVEFKVIGYIRSGHEVPEKTPIQPVFAGDCPGRAEVLPEYQEGLEGLSGFTHLYLFYQLNRQSEKRLRAKPLMGDHEVGIFASRHPARPNPLGMSLVKFLRCEGGTVYFSGCDVLNDTPLLDIKPYVPRFDHIDGAGGGWTESIPAEVAKQRGRRNFDSP